MKKLTYSTLAIIALGAAFMIGCKGKEKKAPKGEVEVVVPCSGPDFFKQANSFVPILLVKARIR